MKEKSEFEEITGAVVGLFWLCSVVVCWVKFFIDLSQDIPHLGRFVAHIIGGLLIIPAPIAAFF